MSSGPPLLIDCSDTHDVCVKSLSVSLCLVCVCLSVCMYVCSPLAVCGCVVSMSVSFCVCGAAACTLSQTAVWREVAAATPIPKWRQCAPSHCSCPEYRERRSREVPSQTPPRITTGQPSDVYRNPVGAILFGSAVSWLTPQKDIFAHLVSGADASCLSSVDTSRGSSQDNVNS